MAANVSINVNGTEHLVQADPDTPLLYVLRNEMGLHATKFGCGLAQCGVGLEGVLLELRQQEAIKVIHNSPFG